MYVLTSDIIGLYSVKVLTKHITCHLIWISNHHMKVNIQTLQRLPRLILFAALLAASTILICFILASIFKHYPSEVLLPFISLTGYKFPERILYAVGFSITGAIFIYCAYHIHYSILPVTKVFSPNEINRLFIILCSGVICFIIHAIVPLQDDITTAAKLTFGSKLHQSCAGVFFFLVLVHTSMILYATYKRPGAFTKFDPRGTAIRRWALFGCGLTFVVAMFVHPTTVALFGSVGKYCLL